MTDDLLSAVDALTLPVKVRVTQDILTTRLQPDGRPAVDGDGNPVRDRKGTQTVTVEHDPLLVQLETAIASSIGDRGGASKALAFSSSVIDGDALRRFMIISSTIRDWCRIVGVRPSPHPVEALRAWYVGTLTRPLRSEEFYREQMRGWVGEIRSKINPRRQQDLPDPCPACQATTWEDADGNAGLRPLLYTWQPDHPRVLETAVVRCRACDTEWKGLTAVRAVAFDLEQQRGVSEAADTTTNMA